MENAAKYAFRDPKKFKKKSGEGDCVFGTVPNSGTAAIARGRHSIARPLRVMDRVRDMDRGRVRHNYRVSVRDRDRRSEPNLLRLLSSTKTYHISDGGP